MMKRRLILCLVPALVVYLSGCASSQQALYAWGSYETQVYAYLQEGKSPEAQIEALERDQEKIEASGKTALPGFYAHLGMLYANVGNDAKAIACFVTEKTRFPEATPFMDFLLKKYQK